MESNKLWALIEQKDPDCIDEMRHLLTLAALEILRLENEVALRTPVAKLKFKVFKFTFIE